MRLDSVRELKGAIIEQILSGRLLHAVTGRAAPALSAANIVADAGRQASLALGISRRAGKGSAAGFRLAVRVQQRPLDGSVIVAAINNRARGEADVRYVGRIRPAAAKSAWPRERQRPLLMGCSVGHPAATAGTLGCFARGKDGRLALISNNHVLAAENAARIGDPILQPGPIDGGRGKRDTVARLLRFRPLKPGAVNRVDAALAPLEPSIEADPFTLRGLGTLVKGEVDLDVGQEVAKLGRTSGLTRGRISAVELDNVVIDYGIGRLRFDDQLEIESIGPRAFSLGGDSGALIVDQGLYAAALLFAGSDHGGQGDHGLTYATPIRPVLRALAATLAV